MDIIDIFLLILLITASIFFISLIFYLSKLSKQSNEILLNVKEITEKAIPAIDKLDHLSGQLISLTEDAKAQLQETREIIDSVKEKMNFFSFRGISEKFKSGNPAEDIVKNLRAISKGISAFWGKIK